MDALGYLIKLHGDSFMPFFDASIAPSFAPYLQPNAAPGLQAVAVCLVDDALEFGGASGQKYLGNLLPTLLGNFLSEHGMLAQSCVYGVARACCCAVPSDAVRTNASAILAGFYAVLTAVNSAEDDEDEVRVQCCCL